MDGIGIHVPFSTSERQIKVHVGSEHGVGPGSLLVFKAHSSSGDYYNEMTSATSTQMNTYISFLVLHNDIFQKSWWTIRWQQFFLGEGYIYNISTLSKGEAFDVSADTALTLTH